MTKITKIQIVSLKGKWGGYKVKQISAGGRTMSSYDYQQQDYRRARQFWKAEALKMGAEFIDLKTA